MTTMTYADLTLTTETRDVLQRVGFDEGERIGRMTRTIVTDADGNVVNVKVYAHWYVNGSFTRMTDELLSAF